MKKTTHHLFVFQIIVGLGTAVYYKLVIQKFLLFVLLNINFNQHTKLYLHILAKIEKGENNKFFDSQTEVSKGRKAIATFDVNILCTNMLC